MSAIVPTTNISASFIAQMIPHHRAAIAMSENLLRYTTNIPLQDIALNIISSQEKSIRNMTAAKCQCGCCINSPQNFRYYDRENRAIINTMFCEMQSACTDNHINGNFIREMIPHHMGAVRMSENALRVPLCRDLIPLLEAIITSQKEGIRQMQMLLQKICC